MTQPTVSGEETTAKKVITFQRAMIKKVVSFFLEKIGWHCQFPPRVTPTLVTPLSKLGVYK